MSALSGATARAAGPAVHRTIAAIRGALAAASSPPSTVGFVPTMGALHEGHLGLVRAAHAENDLVVASVFVNPTQFAPGDDFDVYPRNLEEDVRLLGSAGADMVFAPDDEEMYPPSRPSHTFVELDGFDDTSEGASRPGHFRGVATIVTKLFNIIRPTAAYFGSKDVAQCVLIRNVVRDLDMSVRVRVCDTVREADGLAMSSRNLRLTPPGRAAAPCVYRALSAVREAFGAAGAGTRGAVPAGDLAGAARRVLAAEPLVEEVHYVAVDHRESMRPVDGVGTEGAIVSVACRIGSVRLIDNIVL